MNLFLFLDVVDHCRHEGGLKFVCNNLCFPVRLTSFVVGTHCGTMGFQTWNRLKQPKSFDTRTHTTSNSWTCLCLLHDCAQASMGSDKRSIVQNSFWTSCSLFVWSFVDLPFWFTSVSLCEEEFLLCRSFIPWLRIFRDAKLRSWCRRLWCKAMGLLGLIAHLNRCDSLFTHKAYQQHCDAIIQRKLLFPEYGLLSQLFNCQFEAMFSLCYSKREICLLLFLFFSLFANSKIELHIPKETWQLMSALQVCVCADTSFGHHHMQLGEVLGRRKAARISLITRQLLL